MLLMAGADDLRASAWIYYRRRAAGTFRPKCEPAGAPPRPTNRPGYGAGSRAQNARQRPSGMDFGDILHFATWSSRLSLHFYIRSRSNELNTGHDTLYPMKRHPKPMTTTHLSPAPRLGQSERPRLGLFLDLEFSSPNPQCDSSESDATYNSPVIFLRLVSSRYFPTPSGNRLSNPLKG